MKLAIVKPDHLGDLVLSSPAIRAMANAHPELTLFVAERCLDLAHWLFPAIDVRPMNLPHLAKVEGASPHAADLSCFDAVAFLRRDGVITPQWADLRSRRYVMFNNDNLTHQTLLDYGVALEFAPAYDIDALFFKGDGDRVAAKIDRPIRHLGLSIGSGFYTNVWPLVHWIGLARALARRGIAVSVVCGPGETVAADILMRKAGLTRDRLILGGSDFGAFMRAVDALDLVIASDGGTAHLCSLTTPVLSIFGSSPFMRYSPYGRRNWVITQRLQCSPCVQHATDLVNGCLSVECMANISPDDVMTAMDSYLSRNNEGSIVEHLRPGLHLLPGVSHRDQAAQLALRDAERRLWAA